MGAGKVRKAFRWSAVGTIGTELLGLVFLVVLARLLTPGDYGLAAIVGTFLAVGRIMTEVGFDRALVQSLRIDADDETTAFYANLVLGVLTGAAMAVAAPWVADFYHEPRLAPMLQAAALQPPILSFALLQFALLERELDFRIRCLVEVGATLGSGIVAVGMAFAGLGAWSLVGQFLGFAVLRAGSLALLHPWRPRGRFSRASLARMWGFSWRLAIGKFITTAFGQVNTLVIGRLFGLVDVGIYNRARNLQSPLGSALNVVVIKVSFSAFARMQEETERLRNAFRRVLRVLAGANAAMMFGIAGVAAPLVDVVLSPRWAAAAPLLQAFAMFGLFQTINHQYAMVAQSLGRTGITMVMNIVEHSLSVTLLVITWRWGILAVVLGMTLRTFIMSLVWAQLANRLIGYRWRQQIADLAPQMLAGLFAGVVAGAVVHLTAGPPIAVLAGGVAAGIAAWSIPVLLLRNSAFSDIYDEAGRLLRRKTSKADKPERQPDQASTQVDDPD